MTFTCRRCSEKFPFNNKFHYHIRRCKVTKSTAVFAVFRTIDVFHNQFTSFKIVHSIAPAKVHLDHDFRFWRYVKIQTSINSNDSENLNDFCFDIDCELFMIDRSYLVSKRFDYVKNVIHIDIMKINDIELFSLCTSERIFIEFFISNEIDGKSVVARFTRYVYIVKELKTKLLLNNDILGSKNMIFHLNKEKLVIDSCDNFIASLIVTFRFEKRVKRIIRAQTVTTILFHSVFVILIKFRDSKLLIDRNYMFNSNSIERLEKKSDVFFYIVDVNFDVVQIRNVTNKSIFISKNERLDVFQKYEKKSCYLINSKHRHFAVENWIKKVMKLEVAALTAFQNVTSILSIVVDSSIVIGLFSFSNNTTAAVVFTINIDQEYTTPFDIIVYDTESSAVALIEVVEFYSNFWKKNDFIVNLSSNKWMFINLQSNAIVQLFKIYSISQTDKNFIDKKFDKLQAQDKLKYTTQPTSYSYSMFVVWRTVYHSERFFERKKRVIVDIRSLNKITKLNTYFMSLQTNITTLVTDCSYISVFDAVSFFYQWLVRLADRYKFTIMSHREQKQFNIAVMSYKNSSPYVQKKIDFLLRIVRRFAKAYVDDIVVFSRTLKEHKAHLHEVFGILDSYEVRLASKKSYLGYSTIALLKQKIDAFDFIIIVDKLTAIANLKFSHTLKNFEGYLSFIGWLRNYIAWYAQKSNSLQKRKTMLLRNFSFSKSRQRKVYFASIVLQQSFAFELKFYRQLQKTFNKASLLIHHDFTRVIYIDVDAFKRRDFGVIIYHLKNDANSNQFKRTDIEFIMFLSRMLTFAEKRYWFIEFEITGLV